MLGPVFDARVDDWPKHLGLMNRFWQSILLSAGNFTGNPMMKHLAIPTIGQEHFQQWLRLFYQTLHAIAPSPEAVAHVGAKARMETEERRVGKEGVSPCRFRWEASHKQKHREREV